MLLISHPELFSTYKNDSIYAHILAFRPNTERDPEIIITDYTKNERLREKTTNDENRLGLAADQRMVFKINQNVLGRIQDEYKAKTQFPLFSTTNVHLDYSRWIETSLSFCFVKLHCRFKKGLEGYVTNGTVVSSYQDEFQGFWARFLKEVIPNLSDIPSCLIRMVENCIDNNIFEALRAALEGHSDILSFVEEEKASTLVKQEDEFNSQELEVEGGNEDQLSMRNSLFQKTLEPVSQDNFSESFLGSSSSMKSTDANIPQLRNQPDNTEEFLTQLGTNPEAVSTNTDRINGRSSIYEPRPHEGPSMKTIESITRLPKIVDGRIHKIRAQVVGYFPQELAHLCTKLFISKNGEVKTTGPQFGPLKLVLADLGSLGLNNENCIIVQIPKALVLKFFACKHVEQLYILLKSKQKDLDKLLDRTVAIEISLVRNSRLNEWVSRNITLENLLS